MQLMTKAIAEKLYRNDQKVIETGQSPDEIVVKFFNPTGAQTWHIVSGTPVDTDGEPCEPADAADWHMFGLCNLGDDRCAELGYVLLSDLQVRRPPFGLTMERDRHYSGSLTAEQEKCRQRAAA